MNAARTGRKPAGPQITDRLEGSRSAKQQLKVILETITGQLTVPEACGQLGIGESRFHQLRKQTLQATLQTLEPRPLGRPSKRTSPEQTEIDTLQSELRQVQAELELARLQLQLAAIHPGLIDTVSPIDHPPSKKNDRSACQHCQQRRPKHRHRKAK